MYMPYTAFIFLLGMKYFPKNPQGKFMNAIKKIGNSTYHILLFQSLYFSIIYHLFPYAAYTGGLVYNGLFILYLFLNYSITIPGGFAWYEVERRVRAKYGLKKVNMIK